MKTVKLCISLFQSVKSEKEVACLSKCRDVFCNEFKNNYNTGNFTADYQSTFQDQFFKCIQMCPSTKVIEEGNSRMDPDLESFVKEFIKCRESLGCKAGSHSEENRAKFILMLMFAVLVSFTVAMMVDG